MGWRRIWLFCSLDNGLQINEVAFVKLGYTLQLMHQLRGYTQPPIFRRNCDCSHVTVPIFTDAFCFTKNVAHHAATRTLGSKAILGPSRKVLKIERHLRPKGPRPQSCKKQGFLDTRCLRILTTRVSLQSGHAMSDGIDGSKSTLYVSVSGSRFTLLNFRRS